MEFQAQQNKFKFGTWNVRGLNEKYDIVLSEISRENVDLVVLTETKIKGKGVETGFRDYTLFYSGINEGHARAGVALLIKNQLIDNSLDFYSLSESLIYKILNLCGQKTVVVGVYWLTKWDSPQTEYKFRSDLMGIIEQYHDHELFILGDFNARVGSSDSSSVVGKYGEPSVINTNGRKLKLICDSFNLKIQNTFFQNFDEQMYTWYPPSSRASPTVIDYLITKKDSLFSVDYVRACRHFECGTDHVFLEGYISSNNKTPPFPYKNQQNHPEIKDNSSYCTYIGYLLSLFQTYFPDDCLPGDTCNKLYQDLNEIIAKAVVRTNAESSSECADSIEGLINTSHLKNIAWELICDKIDTSISKYKRRKAARIIVNDFDGLKDGNRRNLQVHDEKIFYQSTDSVLKKFENESSYSVLEKIDDQSSDSVLDKFDDQSSDSVPYKCENMIINEMLFLNQLCIDDITDALDDLEDFNSPADDLKDFSVPADDMQYFSAPADDLEDFNAPADDLEDLNAPTDDLEDFKLPAGYMEDFNVPPDDLEDFNAPADDLKDFEAPADDLEDFNAPTDGLEDFNVWEEDFVDFNAPEDDLEYFNVPADDQITIKHLKYVRDNTKQLLVDLILQIFKWGELPDQIRTVIVDASNVVLNQQAVRNCFMHPIMRVMREILNKIIKQKASIPFKNFDYSCEKGNEFMDINDFMDATFILRQILRKTAMKNIQNYRFVFIDLKDIFPKIKCSTLLNKNKNIAPSQFIKIIEHFERNYLQIPDINGEGVICDSLYYTSFKVCLKPLLKKWKLNYVHFGIKIGNIRLFSFFSGDSKLVIVSEIAHDNPDIIGETLFGMLSSLKNELEIELGINLNLKNVKYLSKDDIRIGDEVIKGEKWVEFHDAVLQLDGRNDVEIHRRIIDANDAIEILQDVAKNNGIRMDIKKRIYESVIQNILIYGCETWTMTEDLKKKLDKPRERYYRLCCEKYPKKNTKEEIYRAMNIDTEISQIIMLKKYAWHTYLRENSDSLSAVKQIFDWEPSGSTNSGRPMTKWSDDFKSFENMLAMLKDYNKDNNKHAMEAI